VGLRSRGFVVFVGLQDLFRGLLHRNRDAAEGGGHDRAGVFLEVVAGCVAERHGVVVDPTPAISGLTVVVEADAVVFGRVFVRGLLTIEVDFVFVFRRAWGQILPVHFKFAARDLSGNALEGL